MVALAASVLLVCPCWLPTPALADPDEIVLRDAGIDCRGEALIAFLKQLPPDERMLGQLDDLVRRLGSPKFKERDAAFKSLIQLGPAAWPTLKKAIGHSDIEIRT